MPQRPSENTPSDALGSPVAKGKRRGGGRVHLVIGDSHHKPGVSTDRAVWLARLVWDVKADVVVCLGDHFDMKSLCSYDEGKGDWSERSYQDDIDVGREARRRFCDELEELNRGRPEAEQVTPRLYAVLGNHENRISRVVYEEPRLRGVMGLRDVECKGWKTIPFLKPLTLDGVVYRHYLEAGTNTEKAMAGIHHAYNLYTKGSMPCIVGHSHLLGYYETTRADNKVVPCFVAGCYFEHYEDWATLKQNKGWARGLLILRDVRRGTYDFEWMGMKRIKEVYG